MFAAQEISQIDTEITQKGHFRMETIKLLSNAVFNDTIGMDGCCV